MITNNNNNNPKSKLNPNSKPYIHPSMYMQPMYPYYFPYPPYNNMNMYNNNNEYKQYKKNNNKQANINKTNNNKHNSNKIISDDNIDKKIINMISKDLSSNNDSIKIIPITSTSDSNGINDIFRQIITSMQKSKSETPKLNKNISEEKAYEIKSDIVYENLESKPSTLNDLIKLGKMYNINDKDKYAFNFEMLYNIIEPLEMLNNVVGMDKVKINIVNHILYFLLGLEPNRDMMHTIIKGEPGVGKTMLGKIIGMIYHKMGIIKGSDKTKELKFKTYKRSDLIGQYLGHTAQKTQQAIDESIGGVMFIDEAYSLGAGKSMGEKSDSYSKECIDTLNQNLSERAGEFICIIAGYADELEKCFFSLNKGLSRRFTFRYTIDKYNNKELAQIFCKKIYDSSWKLDSKIYNDLNQTNINPLQISNEFNDFIKTNYKYFPHYAGDIETFVFHTKIAHGKRIFGSVPNERKIINFEDIKEGFILYKNASEIKENSFSSSMFI